MRGGTSWLVVREVEVFDFGQAPRDDDEVDQRHERRAVAGGCELVEEQRADVDVAAPKAKQIAEAWGRISGEGG